MNVWWSRLFYVFFKKIWSYVFGNGQRWKLRLILGQSFCHKSSTVLFVLFVFLISWDPWEPWRQSIVEWTVYQSIRPLWIHFPIQVYAWHRASANVRNTKYNWNAETTVSVHMGHALFSVLLRAHFSAALHILLG